MATYGSFATNSVGAFYFTFEWSRTGYNSTLNEHYIYYKVTAHNTAGNYRTVHGKQLSINGTLVYNNSTELRCYEGTVITEGNLTIPSSNTQGDGTVSAAFYGQVGTTSSFNASGSGSWALDRIPRYPTCYQSLKSRTDNSITMNWSSDTTIDALYYSVDGGTTWNYINNPAAASGSYTISGLNPLTTYSIATRMRSANSQLTANSSTTNITTYDIARFVDLTELIHGDTNRIKINNPGGRYPVTLTIINNNQNLITRNISATEYDLTFTEAEADQIYELYGRSGELTVQVSLIGAGNGFADTLEIPLYYKGNQRTARINRNGFKRGKVLIHKQGSYKRGSFWENVGGTWRRCK